MQNAKLFLAKFSRFILAKLAERRLIKAAITDLMEHITRRNSQILANLIQLLIADLNLANSTNQK